MIGLENTDVKLKPVIIIAIAFVLLVPVTVFAQDNLVDYYKNLKIEGPTSEFEIIDEYQSQLNIIGFQAEEMDYDEELDKLYSVSLQHNDYADYRGVYVTDSSLEKIEKFIPIGKTNVGEVKINSVTKKAYVTLMNEEQIMVIDVKTDTILKIISLSEFDLADDHKILHQITPLNITIDELTNTIYFSYMFQIDNPVRTIGGIGMIDGDNDIIKDKILLDVAPQYLFIDEISKKMFVGSITNDNKSQLIILDLNKKENIDRLHFDTSILAGFVSHEDRLYFVQYPMTDIPGMIHVLDMDSNRIISSFDTGIGSWSLDIDEENERLFVSTGYHNGIQIFDLNTYILIDTIETTGLQDPIIYDEKSNSIFLGMSNGIKKITPKLVQNKFVDLQTNNRQTPIHDFPSISKSPESYVGRYYDESEYKLWFDGNFPDNSIEEIVEYTKTHVVGFPDNSKSPEYYVGRYFEETDYKLWFDAQFPNKYIQNVLGISNQDTSKILTNLGDQNMKSNKYENAINKYENAIKLFPENIEAHTGKGFAESNLMNNEKAILSFEQALKIVPNHPDAIFGLGDSNYYLGNLKEAKQFYESALKLEPNDEYGLSFLGLTLSEMNNEEGLEYIESSLNLNPENIDLIYNKALALYNLQKYEDAIQTLDTVLEKDPSDIDALEFKNEILKESGILKEQRLSSSFPEKVDSRCELVYLIIKEGETNGFFGLSPSEDAIEKIELITQEYRQRVSDEPWNVEEIGLELHGEMKEIMVDSIMKKYSIHEKFRTGMFDLITVVGTYDQDILRGLYQLEPEDYVEDVECGKLLKLHYFDSLNEINILTYGKSTAEQMEGAIDEAITNAENKKSSNVISTTNDKVMDFKGGGCLIATATYGSELAPQVQQLREIRDNSLLTTTSGMQFMSTFNDFYYSFSPVIADYERENPVFKEMVKIAITPMVSSLSILNYVDMDSEESVLGYGISLIILNGLMYVGIPVLVMIRIKP